MKRVLLSAFSFVTFSCWAAPSFRMPQMPKGLTTTKDPNKRTPKRKKTIVTQPRKIKRKGLQGYKKYHTFSEMDYDELKTAKIKNIESKNLEIATRYLERMITLCEDITEKAELIVQLADIHFSLGEHDKAKKWYQEFEILYPGNKLIQQAQRRIILCIKQKILSVDRDQEPTRETLRLTKAYLERYTTNEFTPEITKIKTECEELLAQAECGIASFYIKHGNYLSAERRIKQIRSEWLETVPSVAVTLAQLEVDLGTVWSDFTVPEESVKLTQLTQPPKKINMANRF